MWIKEIVIKLVKKYGTNDPLQLLLQKIFM